jgi:cellulose synthase/poly-beta-1,6-N-acetylglucosamine synthase-like glycosyltransferase
MPTAEIETITAPVSSFRSKESDLPAIWSEPWPASGTLPVVQGASEILPRVSVVIPTRGRPELAERAVRSVLAQGFEEFEIVVVIDGPDRETGETLRRFRDERLHVVHLAENVGGSEARNIGVRFARGGVDRVSRR